MVRSDRERGTGREVIFIYLFGEGWSWGLGFGVLGLELGLGFGVSAHFASSALRPLSKASGFEFRV